MYSKSKFSNWRIFDPYLAEYNLIRYDTKPTSILVLSEETKIKIFERPLHESFLRPFTLNDIEATLRTIPEKFVRCMKWLILLGGTKKQEKTTHSKFCYGMYWKGEVALCAYPKNMMEMYFYSISPHELQHFERVHAKITKEGNNDVVRFDEASLKTFYLHHTLVHEIGHAVNDARKIRNNDLTEEFAEWFVREYGFRYNTET